MSGYRRTLFRQESRNFLVILAVSICAVVLLALCPANSELISRGERSETGNLLNRLLEANLCHFQTELSDARLSVWQNVSIDQPSPRDKHQFVVNSLSRFKDFGFLDISYSAFHVSMGADLERGIPSFFSNELLFTRFIVQGFRKKIVNSWSCWRIASVLPQWGELPNLRSNRNECLDFTSFDLLKCYIGTLYRMQGLGTYFVRAVGGDGGFLHFAPLEPSVVRIYPYYDESGDADNNGNPIALRISEKAKPFAATGFFCTALFCWILSFWLVDSASRIEHISIINVSKGALGTILIFVGWAAEHACLDLVDLGRIYWKHLF